MAEAVLQPHAGSSCQHYLIVFPEIPRGLEETVWDSLSSASKGGLQQLESLVSFCILVPSRLF
jgi:hypothetical protein